MDIAPGADPAHAEQMYSYINEIKRWCNFVYMRTSRDDQGRLWYRIKHELDGEIWLVRFPMFPADDGSLNPPRLRRTISVY